MILASGAGTGAALLLCTALAAPASAQGLDPFGDPDDRQQLLEPSIPLPEGRNGTIRFRPNDARVGRIDRLGQVFQALQACWSLPADASGSGQEATLRLAFRRDGTVLGEPRVTFYSPGPGSDGRGEFIRSLRAALAQCSPLPFSAAFGAANAGRPFNLRFIDSRPL
ncbi:MAG: cell envelope integrity protein TolA [Microvirga sp.]